MGILFCSHLTSLSSKEVTFFNKPLQRNPLYCTIIIPFSTATYKSTHSSVANFWHFIHSNLGKKIYNSGKFNHTYIHNAVGLGLNFRMILVDS